MTDLLLNKHTFVTRFGSSDPRNAVLTRLHALVTEPAADDGLEWLQDLMDWLFESGAVPGAQEPETALEARTRLLMTCIDELPGFAQRLRDTGARALANTSATHLFTDTGIPTHAAFWREVLDRSSRGLLPPPPVGRELSRLVGRLFSSEERAEWLLHMPHATRRKLTHALGLAEAAARALEPGIRDAQTLLATRIATHGVSDDLRRRLPALTLEASPFLALPAQVAELQRGETQLARVDKTITAAHAALNEVTRSLDDTGISIDLVFRLELVHSLLTRLSQLLSLSFALEEAKELAQVQLERELIMGTVNDRSLRALVSSSTRLLARRVVERAGTSGEHYVTRTRTEQREMLHAAVGGGAITAMMVLLKFFIGHAHAPPLFDALLIGGNYALGFVAMQLLHFALATKQPAMTAATIAGAIEAQRGEERPELSGLVDLIARASRTQFAALVGNVLAAAPFSLAVALVFRTVTGHDVLSPEYAAKTIQAHHPLFSATIFSAAMTGVWLWASSLLAGAAENYFVLRELPGAFATSRTLRKTLGTARAAKLSRFLTTNIQGFGGNVGFGLLLGFMPLLFHLVGIPLEVRHVTFVTGQLTYAVVAEGLSALARNEVLLALLSVPLVGALNFSVSFAFALFVALRARGLGLRGQLALARAVGKRFVTRPLEFFLAPKHPSP